MGQLSSYYTSDSKMQLCFCSHLCVIVECYRCIWAGIGPTPAVPTSVQLGRIVNGQTGQTSINWEIKIGLTTVHLSFIILEINDKNERLRICNRRIPTRRWKEIGKKWIHANRQYDKNNNKQSPNTTIHFSMKLSRYVIRSQIEVKSFCIAFNLSTSIVPKIWKLLFNHS